MQGKDAHWAGSPRPGEPYPKRLNLLLLRQNHRYQLFSIVFLFPYRFPTAAVPRHFHDHIPGKLWGHFPVKGQFMAVLSLSGMTAGTFDT